MATDLQPVTSPQSTSVAKKKVATRRLRGAGLIGLMIVALLLAAVVILPRVTSSGRSDPKLTHTIRRGDLRVIVKEQGLLESSENTEIKCKVRGQNTVIWVVEGGTEVQPGDELVRLDTLLIEEAINERSKYAHWSRSASERSKADVARSELAISEYLEGRYRSELMTLEKDLAIAQSQLRTAQAMLSHAEMMSERGYISDLDVEEKQFRVKQAELDVDVKSTEIDVLKRFTKEMELKTLKGRLAADTARHEADKERAFADAHRRDRALEEHKHCVIYAERSGLVIYPSAAEWKNTPDIEEGATVHKDQVLLLMPNLKKMQVKIGVHESIVDRIKEGLAARVTLPEKSLQGTVSSVATVTQPAGWWTGNVVKYDTIIELPPEDGLKPGMSAEVEVVVAAYEDVLTIPVAAVVETANGHHCWVKTEDEPQKRTLQLGDSNDIFIVVEAGVREGEQVILNPLALVDEAQSEVLQPSDVPSQERSPKPDSDITKVQSE